MYIEIFLQISHLWNMFVAFMPITKTAKITLILFTHIFRVKNLHFSGKYGNLFFSKKKKARTCTKLKKLIKLCSFIILASFAFLASYCENNIALDIFTVIFFPLWNYWLCTLFSYRIFCVALPPEVRFALGLVLLLHILPSCWEWKWDAKCFTSFTTWEQPHH